MNPFSSESPHREAEIASALGYKEFPIEGNNPKDGIRTTSGQLIWEYPNPQLIKLLQQTDPRVEYFPSEIPSHLKDQLPFSDDFAWEHLRNSEWTFGSFTGDRLSDQIRQEFRERLPVAVRGIACSINGGVFSNGILVRDIREILQLGESQGRNYSLFTGITTTGQGFHDRTNQYLATGAESLRDHMSKDPKSAGKLFPALLVYDKDKLVKGSGYSAQLPEDKESRSKAILKAYILDCPIFPKKP